MTEPKHTPGPWILESPFPDLDGYKIRGGTLSFRKGTRLLAVVKNQGERPVIEDSLSDARLIAAAPDLLEACKYMHKLLVDMGHGGLAAATVGENAIARATKK